MSHRRSWMQLLSVYHYSQVADMVLSAAQDNKSVISDVFAEALSDTSPSYQNAQDLCEILLIKSPSAVLDSVYSHISSFEASKEITRGYQTYFTLFARLFRTVLAKVCTLISFSFDFDADKYEKAYVQAIVFLKEEVTAKKLYSPAYMPLVQQACSYLRDDGRDDSEMFTLLQDIANLIIERSTWAKFSSDKRTYTVSKDVIDEFVWHLFCTEITEPTSPNGEIRVKKYRKAASWLIIKTFGRVASLSSSANFLANAHSSVSSYSEQLNIYDNKSEMDSLLIQKNHDCKPQSLIESADCSELSVFKNIMINDGMSTEEIIKNYGNIDELFVYTTPELVFPTLRINNGYGGHLDIPIIPGLWADDISEESFVSLSASILYTAFGQPLFLDTLSLIMSFVLVKQHTNVAPLFDLLSLFLWCCKQDVKGNLVTCPKQELTAAQSSSSGTELPTNWGVLSSMTNKSQSFYSFMLTMLSFIFLSMASHPIVSTSLLSSYSGSIERQMLSSYAQNSLFSTPLINFLSSYSESFKELPSFIRLPVSTDGKDADDIVTLLNRSIVDIVLMIPYGLLLLLLKQGFRSIRKLIIEQTIVLSNTCKEQDPSATSFIPGLLHVFDSFVVEPLCEPHHGDARIFIANSCLQSLVRTGYLLDVYILRLLFPLPGLTTEAPTGFLKYRTIETLVFLQDIDMLSFYINECTGVELFSLASKMHAHLNITFILSYRTFREGPAFCNEFLKALNKSLDGDGTGPSSTRLPYEILLSIYEFFYTLPWMGTVKEATAIKAFFSADNPSFQETHALVATLGNHLSSLTVPNVVTHLHRISGHIIYGSILSTSHYKKVASDFLHCLITDGADPTFLVASLLDSCFPREVKSRILFSDSALSTAYNSGSVFAAKSSQKTATTNQTGSSTGANTSVPGEQHVSLTGEEDSILQQIQSCTGSDRAEPFGYFYGYLCVLQVVRDLMSVFINEKKEESRERIRSVITLIVVKCNLMLSPLPMMNSMLFEGGSIDSGMYSWFVSMIYFTLYQSITICEVKKKELFLEQKQILQSIHNNKNLLEDLSVEIPQFDSVFSELDTLDSSALLSMVDALQKIVNTQIHNLRTQNLSEPDNPFKSIITTKLSLLVDKVTSLKTTIQDIDHKIAEFDSCSAPYTSTTGMAQIYNDLQCNRINEYVSNIENRREPLVIKRAEYSNNLAQLFKEIEEIGQKEEVNNLLRIRDLISDLSKGISHLNAFSRKIQSLEDDIKRIHNWLFGADLGLFSGRFTSNLFWIKGHMKAICDQAFGDGKLSVSMDAIPTLSLDFSAIDANCGFSMEELRESRFSERQYIHAEYHLQMACLLLKDSAKDSAEDFLSVYEHAVKTRFSKCSNLPFYWNEPSSCTSKHSFFSFLDQESSIFVLTIRSTVPSVKFESMLTEYANLFTIANSSQIGIEFMSGAYMSINPLWLSAQFTIDTIEKIACSADTIPAIAFLYGALSRVSEIYSQPVRVFLSYIHKFFYDSKTTDCAKLGEMTKYYSSHNEYYAFRQAYTFANPGYAGSLISSNTPHFYSIPGMLERAISKAACTKKAQLQIPIQTQKENSVSASHVKNAEGLYGISYGDMCYYYAQTTLLPMLYSLVPRYLFIHGVLKQYIANKGNKSISKLPLLLIKPSDHDAQEAGLRIADTDGLPMMGPRSYSKLASRCKSFGLLCGRIFSQRMPIKRCFDLEMLVLMGVTSSFGMFLPDIVVFGVYLALSMHETNPSTQTSVLTNYAILFHFMDSLISKGLLNDMLNNVTHVRLQLIVTTLKLTPFFSKYPPQTWECCTIPKILSYFLFNKLPQEEGGIKDIVYRFLFQGTEQLVSELKSEYETALGRLSDTVETAGELQSQATMELLLDHPISVLRGRIDKVTHILLIGNNIFQKNADAQCMFRAAMKRRTYELMERVHDSSNFDIEQSNVFIYHAVRELPLAAILLSDELVHLKKMATSKGQGQQPAHKQRHQKNKSNLSHHNA